MPCDALPRRARAADSSGVSRRRAPARADGGRDAGNPHPARRERGALAPEHVVGRAVGDDAALAEDDHPRHERQPHLDAVLDDHEGRGMPSAGARSTASRTSATPAGSRFAVGSSSSTQARPHREQRPRARGAASARPTAPWSAGRAARRVRRRRAPRAPAARSRSRGTPRFSQPNATSSPTRARIDLRVRVLQDEPGASRERLPRARRR